MTSKFIIQICSGTTCYVLGGAQLMMLEEMLPADLKDLVEIRESNCLSACKDGQARPPFVKIGDYLMAEPSPGKIIDYLRHHI